jgi:N-acetylglutamate synthase-like GNAT family acetyltransferase
VLPNISLSNSTQIENNQNILSFLVGETPQWNGVTSYYLKEICINNKLQRHGLGKKPMEELEEKLKNKNVSAIYLITQQKSIPSSFYCSLGFSDSQNLTVMGKQFEKNSEQASSRKI